MSDLVLIGVYLLLSIYFVCRKDDLGGIKKSTTVRVKLVKGTMSIGVFAAICMYMTVSESNRILVLVIVLSLWEGCDCYLLKKAAENYRSEMTGRVLADLQDRKKRENITLFFVSAFIMILLIIYMVPAQYWE